MEMSAGNSVEHSRQAATAAAGSMWRPSRPRLRADGVDGWLLYDFRGLNPIAADMTAVHRQGGHLATRRWYYLIPAAGEPRGLVHAIERNSLAHLPGTTDAYAGRDAARGRAAAAAARAEARRDGVLAEVRHPVRVARRRRHDRAGARDRRRGGLVRAISSSALRRCGTRRQIATHRTASEKLYRVKDRAFDAIARRTARRRADDRVRHSAADGRLVSRRRAGQRFRSERVG